VRITAGIAGKELILAIPRPEVVYGATFVALAPSHRWIDLLLQQYVPHPLTGEPLAMVIASHPEHRTGADAVLVSPAHDQAGFMIAAEHGMPRKVVVEPITGIPQTNPEFRSSIVALLHDRNSQKILSIDWGRDRGGNLLVGGGREGNEDPLNCARREVIEETGYYDLVCLGTTEVIHHHYFAHSKNCARAIDAIGVYFELISNGRRAIDLESDEAGKFTPRWLSVEEMDSAVTDPLHRLVFERFIFHQVWTGDGILVDSDEFSGMTTQDSAVGIELKLMDASLRVGTAA
jgi:8-oxo-dGTP pyrophosphatase MutT (NUDIX family)